MGLLLSFQMRRPLAQARRRLVMTFPVVPRELSHTHPQGSVVSSPSVHWAGVRAQRPTTEPPVMKPSRRWGLAPPASLTDHPELWVLGGRQREREGTHPAGVGEGGLEGPPLLAHPPLAWDPLLQRGRVCFPSQLELPAGYSQFQNQAGGALQTDCCCC